MISHSDVRRLIGLLDQAEHLDSLDIKLGDFVLQARKSGAATMAGAFAASPAVALPGSSPAAAQPAPSMPATAPAAATEVPAGMVAVRSPMVGTFYRRPSPDQALFCSEGDTVAIDDTVCLVEVMKMFNTIKSPATGRVHCILAEHGKVVQHDQILMLIEPEVKP